jgi:hypothetical protein
MGYIKNIRIKGFKKFIDFNINLMKKQIYWLGITNQEKAQ